MQCAFYLYVDLRYLMSVRTGLEVFQWRVRALCFWQSRYEHMVKLALKSIQTWTGLFESDTLTLNQTY